MEPITGHAAEMAVYEAEQADGLAGFLRREAARLVRAADVLDADELVTDAFAAYGGRQVIDPETFARETAAQVAAALGGTVPDSRGA